MIYLYTLEVNYVVFPNNVQSVIEIRLLFRSEDFNFVKHK